jgi:metal-responsive CopG/Arc/MetJ family transcriptional regulator
MMAISLKLPDELVEESTRQADRLGITRAELIRQAVRHELQRIQRQQEQLAMASSLRAMDEDAAYRAESDTLDAGLAEALPEEKEGWWIAHSR